MKLLTLNAHSHLETDYERKLVYFAEYALRKQIDLIALQEVNQSMNAPKAEKWLLEGYHPLPDEEIPVRADNHAAWAAFLLRQAGADCRWTYFPVKRGYGRFDEGLAVLSLRREITGKDAKIISGTNDYLNWKRRGVLGVQLGAQGWFYSVHMGWWADEEEPFEKQWTRLEAHLAGKKGSKVYLMGDFNCPADRRGEGYDCIRASGWQDLYERAEKRRGCATVRQQIDGWRQETDAQGLRIDYIFSNRAVRVRSARVIFDGTHEKQVSDHFGILVDIDEHHQEE